MSFAVGTGPGTGQVSLTAVSDYFELCDPECPPDEDTGYYNVSVSSPPTPPSAIISFTAYPARRLDYGTCLAACFTALHAQSTVPYFSLDQARSLTLVYNEDRTSLKPFILVDVQHNPINPDTIKLQVKVNGTYVTFLGANEQTLRFTGGSGSAVPSHRRADRCQRLHERTAARGGRDRDQCVQHGAGRVRLGNRG